MRVRALICAVLLATPCGCARGGPDLDQALLLSLSVFPIGPGGKASTQPGPATLVILRHEGGGWAHEVIEDPESNVFHKALPYTPPGEPPGILTIAGDAARLKLWRKRDGHWTHETLWAPAFGGKHDRLRDLEIADLDKDGTAELVLATHDQGVVAVLWPSPAGGLQVQELTRQRDTFVHEVEVGDADGDGAPEIYATPSQPNRLDDPQSGRVVRLDPAGTGGARVFAAFGARHAKEILVTDLDADGRDEVYVAVEGLVERGARVSSVEIRRYRPGIGPADGELIAQLDDHLCRVLVAADVDGDGRRELVAAPFRAGIFLLRPGAGEGEWEKLRIDADSSGFEHATAAFDLDGDGRDEIYVAADDQEAVRRYVWNGSGFEREEIFRPGGELHGFTWNVTRAPVELTR
jgi:hypothetical protein